MGDETLLQKLHKLARIRRWERMPEKLVLILTQAAELGRFSVVVARSMDFLTKDVMLTLEAEGITIEHVFDYPKERGQALPADADEGGRVHSGWRLCWGDNFDRATEEFAPAIGSKGLNLPEVKRGKR